jgi:hypothetical protein
MAPSVLSVQLSLKTTTTGRPPGCAMPPFAIGLSCPAYNSPESAAHLGLSNMGRRQLKRGTAPWPACDSSVIF